jgi:hypothetical protein
MIHARYLTSGAAVAIAVLTACSPQTQKPVSNAASANSLVLLDQLAAGETPQGNGGASRAERAVANSSDIERTPPVTPASTGALERVQYDVVDPGQLLAPPDAEVSDVWIGWHVNHAIDAFRQAIDKNVPLVLVVSESWCSHCTNLIKDSLRCPAVQRFAGEAVFAISSPSSDKGAMAIAESLMIEAYPTITVLDPEARMLLERGRINGYFGGAKLGEHLETILWNTPPRVYSDQYGEDPNQARAAAAWTPKKEIGSQLGAELGAKNNGLKHAPPEPKCQ